MSVRKTDNNDIRDKKGAQKMNFKNWRIEELTGYKPKTTFYMDFSIAEPFGLSAVCETYTRAMKEWLENIEYVTELSMVLNWKIWEHHEKNDTLAKLYNDLWDKCCTEIVKQYENNKEALNYYYSTTD